MNEPSDIIVADKPQLPVFAIAPAALAERDEALGCAALIGKVESGPQNDVAVKAHIGLKRIAATFEKARKTLKEPLIEAGRQLDRAVASELVEVEKEIGRLANLTAEFAMAEKRRIAEEQEFQRRELARIERERIAELARIERERQDAMRMAQEKADAAAREGQRIEEERLATERAAIAREQAAQRAAEEATNTEQREASAKAAQEAAAARLEGERRAAEARRLNEVAVAETNRAIAAATEHTAAMIAAATDRSDAARYIESAPIHATRATGQVVKDDWKIEVTNPWELAKYHPDCVKIEALLAPIKRLLTDGVQVKGVRADKITVSTVRAGARTAIDI